MLWLAPGRPWRRVSFTFKVLLRGVILLLGAQGRLLRLDSTIFLNKRKLFALLELLALKASLIA